MKTTILKIKNHSLDDAAVRVLAHAVNAGGVIVFPTDTVYGIGCSAFNPTAIKKVYSLKGRRYSKPLPILLGDESQLPLVAAGVPPEAQKLTESFWPGGLTLVFTTTPLALFASGGRRTIAVRVPDYPPVRSLLEKIQIPLAATSANISGKKAMKRGADVVRLFSGKVDLIVDGGECPGGRESTVVDAQTYPFSVLRHGAISKTEIAKVLGL